MLQKLKVVMSIWKEIWCTVKYLKQSPVQRLASMDYNQYWRHRGYHSFQPRFEIFAHYIELGSTVFDIGCGDGLTLSYLSEQRGVLGIGVDLSNQAARFAQQRGVSVIIADIRECDFSCIFDYILLSEVLEHVAFPEDLMYRLKHKYRKNILVSIPNIGFYRHRLRLLFGRFPIQWGWHPAEHLRYWTVSDFIIWAESLGFEVVAVQSSNGFPILHRFLPNMFCNQAVFILK